MTLVFGIGFTNSEMIHVSRRYFKVLYSLDNLFVDQYQSVHLFLDTPKEIL